MIKEPVKRRRSREVVEERDLRIVLDYNSGFTVKQILKRNKVSSPQTIYNALDRVNERLEKSKNLERKLHGKRSGS